MLLGWFVYPIMSIICFWLVLSPSVLCVAYEDSEDYSVIEVQSLEELHKCQGNCKYKLKEDESPGMVEAQQVYSVNRFITAITDIFNEGASLISVTATQLALRTAQDANIKKGTVDGKQHCIDAGTGFRDNDGVFYNINYYFETEPAKDCAATVTRDVIKTAIKGAFDQLNQKGARAGGVSFSHEDGWKTHITIVTGDNQEIPPPHEEEEEAGTWVWSIRPHDEF